MFIDDNNKKSDQTAIKLLDKTLLKLYIPHLVTAKIHIAENVRAAWRIKNPVSAGNTHLFVSDRTSITDRKKARNVQN